MTIDIIIDWLQATLRWAAPLLIVAIGEVYAERSGVIQEKIKAVREDEHIKGKEKTNHVQFR